MSYTWLQRLRVPAGFLFALFYLYRATPALPWFPVGLAIALAGLLLRIWAAGCIRKHEQLSCAGPYAWSRNPLYFGSFLMGLGFVAAAADWLLLLIFLFLFALIYVPVIQREEKELVAAYGSAYQAYRLQTSVFFPLPPGRKGADSGNFSWRRAILNREYNAVTGYVLLAAFLYIKWIWK